MKKLAFLVVLALWAGMLVGIAESHEAGPLEERALPPAVDWREIRWTLKYDARFPGGGYTACPGFSGYECWPGTTPSGFWTGCNQMDDSPNIYYYSQPEWCDCVNLPQKYTDCQFRETNLWKEDGQVWFRQVNGCRW